MSSKSKSRADSLTGVARAMWLVPIILAFLTANQLKVGLDLRHTMMDGEHAIATVTDFEKIDRKDVTYGYVSLRIPLADGSTIEREEMTMPYSLLHRVENKQELEVMVLRGSAQEIVIAIVANAQWKMAVIQSAIALLAFLMAVVGVFAWNRYLRVEGDPATRLRAAPGT